MLFPIKKPFLLRIRDIQPAEVRSGRCNAPQENRWVWDMPRCRRETLACARTRKASPLPYASHRSLIYMRWHALHTLFRRLYRVTCYRQCATRQSPLFSDQLADILPPLTRCAYMTATPFLAARDANIFDASERIGGWTPDIGRYWRDEVFLFHASRKMPPFRFRSLAALECRLLHFADMMIYAMPTIEREALYFHYAAASAQHV